MLTNDEIIELTGVSPELLYKWVKIGKLHPATFPNIGAPCERCGQLTKEKICISCSSSIVGILEQEEKDRIWFNKIQRPDRRIHTYYHK